MTDEQFTDELSAEYLAWSEDPNDNDISGPVEEIQRLCEVIVGLRARVAELLGEREKSKHGHAGALRELENTRIENVHLRRRLSELECARAKTSTELADLREQCRGMEIRETAGNGIIIEQTAEIDRQARELTQLRVDLATAQQISRDMLTAASGVTLPETNLARVVEIGVQLPGGER